MIEVVLKYTQIQLIMLMLLTEDKKSNRQSKKQTSATLNIDARKIKREKKAKKEKQSDAHIIKHGTEHSNFECTNVSSFMHTHISLDFLCNVHPKRSNIFSISVDSKLGAVVLLMWKMTPRYLMEMTTAPKWKMTRNDFKILKIKKLFFTFLVKWELYCHFDFISRSSKLFFKWKTEEEEAVKIHIISLKLWPPHVLSRSPHHAPPQTNCQNDQKFIDLHRR